MRMTKYFLVTIILIVAVGGSLLYQSENRKIDLGKFVTEKESESKTESNEIIKKTSAGAVDLVVEFNNIEENNENYWIFNVSLDTHSVDLDQINLQNSLYFVNGNGRVIEDEIEIEKSGSGHHVSQLVKLPKRLGKEDTIYKDDKNFKMIFKDIDGVEETEFEWDMRKFPDVFDR